jgi:excisionase family DNA binding protein
MKVRECAKRLDISISLVYGLIATGKLKCTRHGMGRGTIRISEEQFTDYLARAEQGRGPQPEEKKSFRHVRLP